jgi:hypothetical protein
MRRIAFLSLLLAALPARVLPQPAPPPPPDQPFAEGQAPAEAPPPQAPPPMPMEAQPPPPAEMAPQAAPAPAGQWVYTTQYGWLWIPYGQQYTFVPGDPRVFPDQYVYYPVYGWRWVVAPWVYGYGPAPYWGAPGVRFFAWYSHPWFKVGGYWGWGGYRGWGRYQGWVGPRAWGARGWRGAPAYYRSGVGGPHPAHFRGEPARREHERERHRGRER